MSRLLLAYSYSCVMAVLPEPLSERMRGFSALIPDGVIYETPDGEHGREDRPHVTVKYGLHTERPQDVWPLFQGVQRVEAVLGGITSFVNKDFVVLKVDVNSRELRRLNRVISERLENTDKFPEYKAHATLAYLKHNPKDPDYWKRYCCGMFAGERVFIDTFLFSTPSGFKQWYELPASMEERVAYSFIRAGR